MGLQSHTDLGSNSSSKCIIIHSSLLWACLHTGNSSCTQFLLQCRLSAHRTCSVNKSGSLTDAHQLKFPHLPSRSPNLVSSHPHQSTTSASQVLFSEQPAVSHSAMLLGSPHVPDPVSEAEVWDRAAWAGVGSRHLVPLQYLSSANSTMANGDFGASTPSVPERCLSEHCRTAHELSSRGPMPARRREALGWVCIWNAARPQSPGRFLPSWHPDAR